MGDGRTNGNKNAGLPREIAWAEAVDSSGGSALM